MIQDTEDQIRRVMKKIPRIPGQIRGPSISGERAQGGGGKEFGNNY